MIPNTRKIGFILGKFHSFDFLEPQYLKLIIEIMRNISINLIHKKRNYVYLRLRGKYQYL